MTFLYTYFLFGLAIPSVIMGLLLVIAFVLSRHFSKKKYSIPVSVAPLICWLVVFLCLLACLSPGFTYPLCAVLQHKSDRYITTGYVAGVTDASVLPLYYDSASHTWSTGKLVTVNNQQYYIPLGDVKVGEVITLVWGSDEQVAYKYSLKTTVSEDEIGTRLVSDNTAVQSDSNFKKIGQLISTISFFIFVIFVLLLYIAKKSVSDFLVKKDKEFTQRIIPSRIGLGIFVVFSLFFLGITMGLVLAGFKEALLVFSFIICVWIVLAVKKMHTELIIKQDSVVVKEGKIIKTFCKDDVAAARFIATRLPFNRCLVITFHDGKEIGFDQLNFWGLSNAYIALSSKGQTNY